MGDWVITLVKNYLQICSDHSDTEGRSSHHSRFDQLWSRQVVHRQSQAMRTLCQRWNNFHPSNQETFRVSPAAEKQNVSVRILTISDGEILIKIKPSLQLKKSPKISNQRFVSIPKPSRFSLLPVPILIPRLFAVCFSSIIPVLLKVANIYKRMSDSDCVASITELFEGDSLEYNLKLQADKSVFKKELWDADMQSSVNLVRGDNLIWLDASQVDALTSVKLQSNSEIPALPFSCLRTQTGKHSRCYQFVSRPLPTRLRVFESVADYRFAQLPSDLVEYRQSLRRFEAQLKLVEELPLHKFWLIAPWPVGWFTCVKRFVSVIWDSPSKWPTLPTTTPLISSIPHKGWISPFNCSFKDQSWIG